MVGINTSEQNKLAWLEPTQFFSLVIIFATKAGAYLRGAYISDYIEIILLGTNNLAYSQRHQQQKILFKEKF